MAEVQEPPPKKKQGKVLEFNRYKNVNKKDIELAKKFIAGNIKAADAPSWIKRFKKEGRDIKVKSNNLFIDGLQVVGNDERDDLMRELVYKKNSDVAPSRDAGYYTIKSRYLNVSRRNWVEFLKKQRVIRQTDNAPPTQKKGGKKIHRRGELEMDLFFLSRKDLPKEMTKTATTVAPTFRGIPNAAKNPAAPLTNPIRATPTPGNPPFATLLE